LARVAPVEGAELIASRMAEVSDRFNAAAALKSIGAPAEPAVRKMLSHQEWQVRLEAVNVLKEIGTKASIDALKPLSETDDFILVKQMAAQAIEAIQKRDK
jgi:HEAT repeat protein